MTSRINLILTGVLTVTIAGCATHYSAEAGPDPYGFLSGIWHGMVFPYSLVTNIFSWFLGLFGLTILDSVQIIGRPNTGLWYYVGFVLGLASIRPILAKYGK